uniref:Uncharacterized protein n=1 Tax=Podoviridae sp. cttxo15 TaxID=2826584 RepID=A0A8S5N2I8_9CAUD|nr:MAG TPA: hypothetical protein [Podoviridae sp. cttxo15]
MCRTKICFFHINFCSTGICYSISFFSNWDN